MKRVREWVRGIMEVVKVVKERVKGRLGIKGRTTFSVFSCIRDWPPPTAVEIDMIRKESVFSLREAYIYPVKGTVQRKVRGV